MAVKEEMNFEQLSAERKELQRIGHLPSWYTTQSWQMFKSKSLVKGEDALLGRHKTIAKTLARHMPAPIQSEWEEKFFNIMWEGILSPASPVLNNTGTGKGMVVSCSGQDIQNSIDSFFMNRHESAMLSKYAFGCSAYFGNIQARGEISDSGVECSGIAPLVLGFADDSSLVTQGSARRGAIGSYFPMMHGDFDELVDHLEHDPDGLNLGYNIYDKDVEALLAGDAEMNRRLSKSIFVKCINGKGYFFFPDKANRHRPQMYKDLGLDIKASNLCSEIMLHSSDEYTYSCILSSLNLVHWDRIKANPELIFIATVFLDCVTSEFLEKSKGKPGLEKVRKFTEKGRAIGLGVLGFQSYLHQNMIEYESLETQFLNNAIFKLLQSESLKASQWLAEILGEPEWCKGYGVRNTHRTALAPTKSTSLLMGNLSEQCFPHPGMIYQSESAAGAIFKIVPEFYQLMVSKGVYNDETCKDIVDHLGSCQHVDWLTPEEKAVFKTAFEIDQERIYRYASWRQKYLCQGQSLNFWFAGRGDEPRISRIMTLCILDPEILSVYYFYSRSGVIVSNGCSNCEA